MLILILFIILLTSNYVNSGPCHAKYKKHKIANMVQKIPINTVRMMSQTDSIDFDAMKLSEDNKKLLRQCLEERLVKEYMANQKGESLEKVSYLSRKTKRRVMFANPIIINNIAETTNNN